MKPIRFAIGIAVLFLAGCRDQEAAVIVDYSNTGPSVHTGRIPTATIWPRGGDGKPVKIWEVDEVHVWRGTLVYFHDMGEIVRANKDTKNK